MPIIHTTTTRKCLVVFPPKNFKDDHHLSEAISEVSSHDIQGGISPDNVLEQLRSGKPSKIIITSKVIKDEFLPINLISATDYDPFPRLTLVTSEPVLEPIKPVKPSKPDMSRRVRSNRKKNQS